MVNLMRINSSEHNPFGEQTALKTGSVRVVKLLLLLMTICGGVTYAKETVAQAEPDTVFLERVPLNAEKPVGLLWPEDVEFSPALNKSATITYVVSIESKVTLNVHGPDGELVRTLLDNKIHQPGRHTIGWDGKDNDGVIVPDEVWVPVLRVVQTDNMTIVDDPRRYSGGEIIPDIRWTVRGNTELSFDVPFPARILIRTGINEGPMMRVLKRWEPVGAGKVVVRWDGYDAEGVEEFAVRDDKWFVVMAYQIPEFAFISTGNRKVDYRAYRNDKSWPEPEIDLSQLQLQRDGIRLSRDYSLPRSFHPGVSITLAETLPVSRTGLPVVDERVRFKINVPSEDRWVLDSSFYETGFYINYQFQSEEEQGFVPMIWDFDASKLPPGRHIATVQLFGFGGFITSATMAFEVIR